MRAFLRKRIGEFRKVSGDLFRNSSFLGRESKAENLWRLNLHSVSWAVSVGLFVAWIPLPFQMFIAAGAALIIRCNLPLCVLLVWISNPLTIPPMLIGAYGLGTWILGQGEDPLHTVGWFEWLWQGMHHSWLPILVGCLALGLASAILGQIAVRFAWGAERLIRLRQRRRYRDRHGDIATISPRKAPEGGSSKEIEPDKP
ncbi:DUF2062 domain-containing protein [Thioalkalivibrio sp. HK1]|uniref:DUF2062 domain-containing protein n=1 Tax=Thioalkalivibrio sp. HK1 TaxID=1469245 RepID=UPI0012DF715A|nr:DUF2062 domain-containing protein [Thioalkalivibrio sp. HK1]